MSKRNRIGRHPTIIGHTLPFILLFFYSFLFFCSIQAVLFHYGRRMGPTVIILHLQRGTSTIGELESWSLGRKASQEGKNLIVVVSTRSFLQEDRNSKTSEIAARIKAAEQYKTGAWGLHDAVGVSTHVRPGGVPRASYV